MNADAKAMAADIEIIGVDRLSESFSLSKATIKGWKTKGIPARHRDAVTALRDEILRSDGENQASKVMDDLVAGIQEAERRFEVEDKQEDDPLMDAEPAPITRPHASPQDAVYSDQPPPIVHRSGQSVPPLDTGEQRKAVRLNRAVVVTVCAASLLAVVVGFGQGFSSPSEPSAGDSGEPLRDAATAQPFSLPDVASYAALTRPDEPILTEAVLSAPRIPIETTQPTKVETLAPTQNSPRQTQQQPVKAVVKVDKEEEAALKSGLFPAGAPVQKTASVKPSGDQDAAFAAIDRLRQSIPTPQDFLPPDQQANTQDEAFLASQADDAAYLKKGLGRPVSSYEIKAGSVIPAALITGLNSDLPGQVIGQVTENVYDTVTGQYLLIPYGTKIFGRYNSRVGYAQKRAQVVWDRLILPNGNSLQLESMVGTDKLGYAGLADQVDNHYGQLIGAVILSSFISVGANLTTDSDNDVVDSLGDAAAQQALDIGGAIVDRQFDVQPTIVIRPGFKLNVLVNKDMIFR